MIWFHYKLNKLKPTRTCSLLLPLSTLLELKLLLDKPSSIETQLSLMLLKLLLTKPLPLLPKPTLIEKTQLTDLARPTKPSTMLRITST